jgi:hypothetical protein
MLTVPTLHAYRIHSGLVYLVLSLRILRNIIKSVIKGLYIVVIEGEKSGSGIIVMQYLNYEEDIIKKARLKLVGWLPDVEFCKLGAIRSVTDLHQL